MPRGSLPKVNSTTLSSTIPSATVAMSQEFEPRTTNGRTATRSTTTPHSAQAERATTIATGSGHFNVTQKVKHRTAPSIMVLPCAKFTVRETAWVTWKPSANNPYMLPRPSPEMIAVAISMLRYSRRREFFPAHSRESGNPELGPRLRGDERTLARSRAPAGGGVSMLRRSIHRYDLVALVVHHDVVVGPECVVIVMGKRRLVGFDQALVGRFQILQSGTHGIRIGRARLRDGERKNVHRVIGVGRADRSDNVLRTLDLRISLLQGRQHALTDRALL